MKRMTKRSYAVLLFLSALLLGGSVMAQRSMEKLDHGLVAVKTNSGVFVSWRVLGSEWKDVAYNVYRDGTKLNGTPIAGASNYLDASGTTSSTYKVKTVVKGVEQDLNETASVWAQNYLDIPVRKIDGEYSGYELNDASVGDLDGDGQYEIVVKRLAKNDSIASTDYHYIEAYELDGTFMWAVNMGPNMYNKVEVNFLVWDLDCDGKAEVTLRTSDGFIDGEGNDIGDADNDGKINYRYSIYGTGATSYRMEGPDYISVLEGTTGKELDRDIYIPRGNYLDWIADRKGDGGHRATKCMFTVAYQDGKTPSVVIGRGIYARIAMASWSFKDGNLTQNWAFDSNSPGNGDYASQGFHNLTQGDVDNDGRDEVMYGSMCMDDNGKGLYSTKLGHGDAQHLSDINPNRKGLEYFGSLENSAGGNYRDAGTGEIFFYKNIGRDMGRAGCADITPDYPGMEMWGPSGFPFLSSTGNEIKNLNPPSSMNFFIWWDGDLSREILDHKSYFETIDGEKVFIYGVGTIYKYNNGANTQLLYATGTYSNNHTKGTPTLTADILGDWREEVIWRAPDNSALRLYTTTNITTHKIYTLMHDPHYRAAIGWQQNSYNQPPHAGFFIGSDMDSVPPTPMMMPGQKTYTTGKWDINTTSAWTEINNSVKFENGDSILFDISGDNSADVVIEGNVIPEDIRVISPIDYVFSGSGNISGTADLTKAGKGTLTINNSNNYSGTTRVWDGSLIVNGSLNNSKVLVKRFAYAAGNGSFNNGVSLENYGNLIVSNAQESTDTLFISGELSTDVNSTVYFDLTDDVEATAKTNDIIVIDGDLTINGATSFNINRLDDKLSAGSYVLATISGTINGDINDITIDGIPGVPFSLIFENNKLILEVDETRLPGKVTWRGQIDGAWDLFNKLNWLNNGVADYFLGEDSVVVCDSSLNTSIDIRGDYALSNFLFDSEKSHSITGGGSIAGETDFIKKGSGKLTIRVEDNTYTGATIIEEGTLKIPFVSNAGYASPIGAASNAASNLVINGGELEIYNASEINTDHNISVGANNGAIDVSSSNGKVIVAGKISGSGKLIKNGSGTLSLKTGNSHKGTIINAGTVQLLTDAANISGLGDTLILNGGALKMNNNSYSYTDGCKWHIIVPEGKSASLSLDSRSSLTGKLLGGGTLNLTSPWIRNYLNGNWSAFTGTINVTGSNFQMNNTYGYANATIFLKDNIYAENIKGGTMKIGALGAESSATLAGGNWSIGHNNKDATFNGTISTGSNISKYGTGNWILPKANSCTGNFNINGGKITVKNSSGSATGTSIVNVNSGGSLEGTGRISGTIKIKSGGICNMSSSAIISGDVEVSGLLTGAGSYNSSVTINKGGIRNGDNTINSSATTTVETGGTLGGEGYVKGDITLKVGSIIAPGTDGTGKLTCYKALTLINGGLLELDINRTSGEKDQLYSMGSITLDGTLKINELSGTEFTVGESYKVIVGSSIKGSFDAIVPATPGNGLEWDLSKLNTYGKIGVKLGTSIAEKEAAGFEVYPNPGSGAFNLKLDNTDDVQTIEVADISGRVVFSSSKYVQTINLEKLPAGIYMLKVEQSDLTIEEKLIIQ